MNVHTEGPGSVKLHSFPVVSLQRRNMLFNALIVFSFGISLSLSADLSGPSFPMLSFEGVEGPLENNDALHLPRLSG